MAECRNCGHRIEEDANFCPRCGASLRSAAIDAMVHDARRAVDRDPSDTSARHNLALAYKLGGLDDLALQEFLRVTELQPDFGDAHYEIGLLHAKAGRAEEAVAALRCALEAEPDHSRARELLERLNR